MFRLIREAVVRVLTRPEADDRDLARETRSPDPYVWRLPTPYEARWRRWHKRSRAAGRYLPFPCEETCRRIPPRPRPPAWHTDDEVVRPYVLRP
ncbi:hypothetical protein [Streptomyces sp. NPDC006134]|uniref:hypothetical protein n=1 Tax=Streptomyces sp. NPDC006134 TaxID=3154467 RepID=UPI0033D161BE